MKKVHRKIVDWEKDCWGTRCALYNYSNILLVKRKLTWNKNIQQMGQIVYLREGKMGYKICTLIRKTPNNSEKNVRIKGKGLIIWRSWGGGNKTGRGTFKEIVLDWLRKECLEGRELFWGWSWTKANLQILYLVDTRMCRITDGPEGVMGYNPGGG